ncbi:MAG: DUF2155 domain-containing protein [Rhodospirillaceae bacterium]|nr:DUF2155 domain-containing protein [Rhodospirillaceae bacterium]
MRLAAVLALLTAIPAMAQTPAPRDIAVLRGLDKITGAISTFEAPLERSVRFGTIEIVVRACRKRPPEEPPESAAFVEIRDVRPSVQSRTLFAGWMFASSPALSALEHAVYDVWVIDCKIATPALPNRG